MERVRTRCQQVFPIGRKGYVTLSLSIGYTIKNFRFEGWAGKFLNDARSYGMHVGVNF